MCEKQGKRCKYADEMSTLRRKHRRKNPGLWPSDLKKLLAKDLESRPELAMHEATRNLNFQWSPPNWSVPYSLTKDMPKIGTFDLEKTPSAAALYLENKEWHEKLNREEEHALGYYSMTGYEEINSQLRGKPKKQRREISASKKAEEKELNQKFAQRIDRALDKAHTFERLTPVYRYYEVPAGINAQEYIEKILIPTGGHKDKAFLSTTANPLHAMATIFKNNPRMDKYVLMEIWTEKGGSMQKKERPRSGNIQSQEHEILLPRNTPLRVIETGKAQHAFTETPIELAGEYRYRGEEAGFIGKKLSVPIIRMIDEQLVRDERNRLRE